ncbi:hypothetical protein JCM15519_08500 [Fundidesulfovibrio butyratiphilus]
MVTTRLRFALIWVLLACLGLCAGEVRAQGLALSNLVVDNQSGRVTVRFGVEVNGLDGLREALVQHRVLDLVCKAQLLRKRDYAWNREISHARRGWTLAVESDDKTYVLRQDDGKGERLRGRDLKALLRQAWNDLTIDLGPWSILTRGEDYAVVLELRLLRQDVSDWAKTTLFFWSFDAAQAAKYQLDFSY